MPMFQVELSDDELDLLGTHNPDEVEQLLAALVDAALGAMADTALLPHENGEARHAHLFGGADERLA